MKDFGAFNLFLDKSSLYIVFRSWSGERMDLAISELRKVVKDNSSLEKDVLNLLSDSKWSAHLVAVTSLLIAKDCSPRIITAMWKTMDSGSWAIPQIAAVLSVVDAEFFEKAKENLKNPTQNIQPTFPEELQHFFDTASPVQLAKNYKNRSKVISALAALYGSARGHQSFLEHKEVQKMINDGGNKKIGRIAVEWLRNAKRLLAV